MGEPTAASVHPDKLGQAAYEGYWAELREHATRAGPAQTLWDDLPPVGRSAWQAAAEAAVDAALGVRLEVLGDLGRIAYEAYYDEPTLTPIPWAQLPEVAQLRW